MLFVFVYTLSSYKFFSISIYQWSIWFCPVFQSNLILYIRQLRRAIMLFEFLNNPPQHMSIIYSSEALKESYSLFARLGLSKTVYRFGSKVRQPSYFHQGGSSFLLNKKINTILFHAHGLWASRMTELNNCRITFIPFHVKSPNKPVQTSFQNIFVIVLSQLLGMLLY